MANAYSKYEDMPLSDLLIQKTIYTTEDNRQKLRNSLPKQLGSYSRSVNDAVNTATAALQQVGRLMERTEEVRTILVEDPTLNEINSRINAWRYGREKLQEINTILRTGTGQVNSLINSIQSDIGAPPAVGAGVEGVAHEIRAHAKSLTQQDRHKFLYTLLENEDFASLSAIFAGPAYLSGMSEQEIEQLEADYTKKRYRQELQLVEALKGILNALMDTMDDANLKIGRLNSPKVQDAIKAGERTSKGMDGLQVKLYK